MKNFITLTFLLLVFTNIVFSFDDVPAPAAELFIANRSTTKDIFVKVIPVGFIFNGKTINGSPGTRDFRYSSEASKPFNLKENHVFGGYKKLPKVTDIFDWAINGFTLNQDFTAAHGSRSDSIIGYGNIELNFGMSLMRMENIN